MDDPKSVSLREDRWEVVIIELERAKNRNSGLRALVYGDMIADIRRQLQEEKDEDDDGY